jgi:RTX calcium-binding nonapeptide repeat (4 copies)
MKGKRFSSLLRFGLTSAVAVATAFAALISGTAMPWRTAQAQTQPQTTLQTATPKNLIGNARVTGDTSTRVAIVGDTLVVEGTSEDDRIVIRATQRPDTVRVVFNGVNLGRYGPVAKIMVNAGDGNDTVHLDPEVTLPARLNGGPGNDRLRGGSGPDLVFGEDGDDVLVGSPGRDALDAGPGSNRVVVRESMGIVQVSPSAAGDVLRILSRAYTLQPLGTARQHVSASELSPIIIGGTDLLDAALVDLLRTAYQAGHTIALASAGATDGELLRNLLGHTSGGRWDASIAEADLVAFRKAIRPDGRTHESTGVLLPRAAVDMKPAQARHGQREADRLAIEWLSGVFSATPVVPDPPPALGDNGSCPGSPVNCLQTLADSYLSRTVVQGFQGSQIQIVNTVWGARSFQNQADLYYILQETDYHGPFSAGASATGASNSLVQPNAAPTTIQPSPQSTGQTTTITSGVSASFSGNIGYNQMQGVNATASAGVTISDSTSVTVPPLEVTYNGNLETGETVWDTLVLGFNGTTTITFFNQWIWEMPFTAYSTTQQNITFMSQAVLGILTNSLTANLTSVVPLPFGDTFALQQPVVTSVSPTCVVEGDEFTITGTGLYPSLVTGVSIDGTPVDPTEFSTVSDTEITVVAPDKLGLFLPVVVQTTQGDSNDNVTIEVSPSCALASSPSTNGRRPIRQRAISASSESTAK